MQSAPITEQSPVTFSTSQQSPTKIKVQKQSIEDFANGGNLKDLKSDDSP